LKILTINIVNSPLLAHVLCCSGKHFSFSVINIGLIFCRYLRLIFTNPKSAYFIEINYRLIVNVENLTMKILIVAANTSTCVNSSGVLSFLN